MGMGNSPFIYRSDEESGKTTMIDSRERYKQIIGDVVLDGDVYKFIESNGEGYGTRYTEIKSDGTLVQEHKLSTRGRSKN